jgi:DNA-directed RNA polymerase subunit RPC12/RpoP
MSMNRFFCTICGSALTIREGSKRRTTECPDCLHVVPVPSSVDSGLGSDAMVRVFPRGVLALELKFLCSSCGTKLRIDARFEGSGVTCPVCDNATTIPYWSRKPQSAATLSADEVTFLSQPHETVDGPAAV